MEITPAIADSHYYGIVDTSCGPKVTLLLFYSLTMDILDVHVLNDIFCCLSGNVLSRLDLSTNYSLINIMA